MAPTQPSASAPPSVFKTGLAFRPFFWLGSVYLILAFLLWMGFWQGQVLLQPLGGMIWWHQHEMLFGFVSAIIAGFLLTAVQTWTGLPSLKGYTLGALVLLWLAARFVIAFPMELDPRWIMAIDGAFLPIVALVMANLVIRAKKWRNLAFTPLLLLLAGANLAMHWGQITHTPLLTKHSAHLTVWLVIALMVLLGGRVIPFFTSRALNIEIKPQSVYSERLTLLSTFALCVVFILQLLGWHSPLWLLSGVLAVFIITNSLRLAAWQPLRCAKHPLLWSLHLSYAFIIVGACFWLLSLWQVMPSDVGMHTLTIGAILGLILAMLARVSLGHTGRPLKALPGFSLALGSVFVAALIRSLVPILIPSWSLMAYQTSLVLCVLAFAWFVVHYTVPLWSARPDHKPG